MADIIEIGDVEPDVNPMDIATVHNPLEEEFTCQFNKKYVIRIPSGGKKELPLPAALHAAKHLAERIVWEAHEKEILKHATRRVMGEDGKPVDVVDESIVYKENKLPIANYQAKVWEAMKKITKSSSSFFKSEDAQRKATGNKEFSDDFNPDEATEIGKEILPAKKASKIE